MGRSHIRRRGWIEIVAAAVFVAWAGWPSGRAVGQTAAPTSQPASLCGTFKDDFLIGTATDFTQNAPLQPADLTFIKANFDVMTPENSMKPQSIHPAQDRWNWAMADELVNFCQENGIKVVGHCLVWHNQTGRWFFEGADGQPVTRDEAIARLREHVETEVGHFKGKIKGWDVVNEAINDSGPGDTENLRKSPWFKAIGPEYITYAYKFAHEADPDVELYYNDYGIEAGNKHKSSLLLISEGVPLRAIGIQGHWALNYLPYKELDAAIDDYKALGLKVNITEMDIGVSGRGGGQLTADFGGPNRAAGGTTATTNPAGPRGIGRNFAFSSPTPEQLAAQAKAYATFFQIFLKHKDVIGRVTLWGLNDGRTWRFGQAPLLFDGQNQPKPAFAAVIALKR
jgi:GH35 family endo-1,4-beta-xylanase